VQKRLYAAVIICLFSASVGAALPEKTGGRDYVELTLLLSRSDADVRLAAKSIARLGSSREMLDVAAEIAWTGCTGRREIDADALSWLAIALGNTKDARYAALLDDCLARTADKKTAKYLTLSRKKIEGVTSAPFAGGAIDLDKLRSRVTDDAGAPSRRRAAEKFPELRRGWTLDETVAAVGQPASSTPVDVHEEELEKLQAPIKGEIASEMIVLAYPGVGNARFAIEENRQTWILVDATSERSLYWLSPAGRLGDVTELITEGGGRVLREFSMRLSESATVDAAMLERIARRIYASRDESDSDTVDALAYFCKVLGKGGNGKYKSMLLEVSESASRKALRKHARLVAEKLPDSEEKFDPAGTCRACGE